tara:strand:+ start:585 stop:1466 length:882 start_codon:yes stop_codon:yes gene_type:complete
MALIGTTLLNLAPSVAAPQTFNTALPIAQEEFVFRGQFLHRSIGDDPLPADAQVDVYGGIGVLGYGVTADLAVFGVLPYFNKTLSFNDSLGQRVSRHASGFGDSRLFARYTIIRSDAPGRTFRIAPFLGVELPSGNDNDRDNLGALPRPLQAGSGSWDPFGGVVLTYQTLDYQIDAQAGYQLNTAANGFSFGDQAQLDASIQYRLWPRTLSAKTEGFFYGVLEGNLFHQNRNRIGGVSDNDSGGTTLFVSPGIQYVTRRWIAEAIVQVPMLQDLNGAALKDDFILRVGLRVNF